VIRRCSLLLSTFYAAAVVAAASSQLSATPPATRVGFGFGRGGGVGLYLTGCTRAPASRPAMLAKYLRPAALPIEGLAKINKTKQCILALARLLTCCLTHPHRGSGARSALAGQGAAAVAAARFGALLCQCSPPTTTRGPPKPRNADFPREMRVGD
jgi:hypothetical protein